MSSSTVGCSSVGCSSESPSAIPEAASRQNSPAAFSLGLQRPIPLLDEPLLFLPYIREGIDQVDFPAVVFRLLFHLDEGHARLLEVHGHLRLEHDLSG